jgi:hypothetical protein
MSSFGHYDVECSFCGSKDVEWEKVNTVFDHYGAASTEYQLIDTKTKTRHKCAPTKHIKKEG